MTDENMARYSTNPNIEFWRNLKQGYDALGTTKRPRDVDVCGGRYVFGAKSEGMPRKWHGRLSRYGGLQYLRASCIRGDETPCRAQAAKSLIWTSTMTQPHRAAVCLLLFALLPLLAFAQNAPINQEVMLQAKKCLKVPGALSYGSYRASVLVTFEGGTPTEIRTTELDPQGSSGRSLVGATTRAIERCGLTRTLKTERTPWFSKAKSRPRSGVADALVYQGRRAALANRSHCFTLTVMSQLLRAIACILLAVAMGSVSLTTAAHGVVVVDETVEHLQSTLSEMPCSDCGSHRLRVCAQSCSASLEPLEPTIPDLEAAGSDLHPPYRAVRLYGLSVQPLLSPPIA